MISMGFFKEDTKSNEETRKGKKNKQTKREKKYLSGPQEFNVCFFQR